MSYMQEYYGKMVAWEQGCAARHTFAIQLYGAVLSV